MRKIFGHRGLPRIYKENTFTGINKAYEHCDFVEIDVRLTGDNQLILHHDPNIGDDLIKNLSLSELDICLLYTSPSPRDRTRSRMPSSA